MPTRKTGVTAPDDPQLEKLKEWFEEKDAGIASVIYESSDVGHDEKMIFEASARFEAAARGVVLDMDPNDCLQFLERLGQRLLQKYDAELEAEKSLDLLESKLLGRTKYWQAVVLRLKRERQHKAATSPERRFRDRERHAVLCESIAQGNSKEEHCEHMDRAGQRPPPQWKECPPTYVSAWKLRKWKGPIKKELATHRERCVVCKTHKASGN